MSLNHHFVLLVALAAAGLTCGCDQSLSRLQKAGVIRIGYAVEAPYALLKPGGEVTGESPEVARQIASQLGIRQVEWCQAEFGELISGLEAGRFDVIAAGMFITPERARRVAFSEPTFRVQQALLVAKHNPQRLHSYPQALVAGVKIATISGSVEERQLRQAGLPAGRLVLVPDALAGRVAVEAGVADGLALSAPTIRWMLLHDTSGKTEMAQPFEQAEAGASKPLGFGAFAFRQSDHALRKAWNAALKTFVGSPEHRRLIAGFGFTASELPGNITTAELLRP